MDAPATPAGPVAASTLSTPKSEHWYEKKWGPLPAWQWLLGAKLAMTAGLVGYVVWKKRR